MSPYNTYYNHKYLCVVPPNITSTNSVITVSEGNTTVLRVYVSDAYPSVFPEAIEWRFTRFNGSTSVIETNGKYNYSHERTALILSDVNRSDRGNYTVIINHQTGSHSFTFQLFITGI